MPHPVHMPTGSTRGVDRSMHRLMSCGYHTLPGRYRPLRATPGSDTTTASTSATPGTYGSSAGTATTAFYRGGAKGGGTHGGHIGGEP
jgi:hypothetical protein